MSEMNRDEAIKRLKCRVSKCFAKCTTCEYRTKANIMIPSIEQAISDMEKLQKIEALYEQQEFGKGISREERDMEVQEILEGNRK